MTRRYTPSMRSAAKAVLVVVAYLAALNVFFHPVQLRIWNHLNGIDILVMLVLVAPFLATRWLSPGRSRATRVAWFLSVVMALDVICFAIMVLAPSGGHPSFESLALGFTGLLKVFLAPAALLALSIAFANGERATIVALGLICVVTESVYILPFPNHPFQWLLLQHWTTHG